MQSVKVTGVNLLPQDDVPEFDCYCPLMSDRNSKPRNNYWQSQCDIKQRTKTLHKTCYPICKLKSQAGLTKRELGSKWSKLHDSGVTLTQIANDENTSPATVTRYIVLFTGKPVPRRLTKYDELAKGWVTQRTAGRSFNRIAAEAGVSASTVRKYVQRKEIT